MDASDMPEARMLTSLLSGSVRLQMPSGLLCTLVHHHTYPSNHSCQRISGGPLPVALQVVFLLSVRNRFVSMEQVTPLQLCVREETLMPSIFGTEGIN